MTTQLTKPITRRVGDVIVTGCESGMAHRNTSTKSTHEATTPKSTPTEATKKVSTAEFDIKRRQAKAKA